MAWTTFGSAPVSTSQAHSRVSSRAAEASAAESASGNDDALEVVDALAELDPLGGPLDGERQQALHRPAAARADVDALLDEPLVGQLVGPAHPAEDGRRRDADVLEDELRVPVGEGVHVVGIVLDPDPGHVVVDEEQRRQAAGRRRRRWRGRS